MRKPTIIKETGPDPTAAVIWLHGLGASGDDFVPVLPHLKLSGCGDIRFLFPHAPNLPVTINQGMVMPAWYDILSMGLERQVDTPQLLASADEIRLMVDEQIEHGIDSRRIVLIGFSQGGAVTYQVALNDLRPLGGLLALSSYLAITDPINLASANQNLPVEIHHGSQDPMVDPQLADRAEHQLISLGLSPVVRRYPMGHQVCLEQLDDISAFLRQVLADNRRL